MTDVDAVVVGSGPNGLVAAATMARAGWRVVVLEAGSTPGGGCRTEELTLPGFRHDVCSAIHPLGIAAPAMRELDLAAHGLRWIHPDAPFGHPLDGGRAAIVERSVARTAASLGDGWARVFDPLVSWGDAVVDSVLSPLDLPPRHPVALAHFGLGALQSATGLAGRRLDGEAARAAFAGLAAHSVLPLDRSPTAGVALMLGTLAHHVGWPMAAGGSSSIVDALVRLIESHGGELRCGERVTEWSQLPTARAVLCDTSPAALVGIAGDRLPASYRRRLLRFRHGAGVFKLDWALDAPIPWADPRLARTATVHVGGRLEEIALAESTVADGRVAERPYVLLAQQSLFDPSRAPSGRHTAWAYCHVPAGCELDQTDAVESQVERFAPGFRDRILARHTIGPAQFEAHNANYVGGDITGGVTDLSQFVRRPVLSPKPWATPVDGLYLCSASTPPGAGVHGMCGRHAAELALARHG